MHHDDKDILELIAYTFLVKPKILFSVVSGWMYSLHIFCIQSKPENEFEAL